MSALTIVAVAVTKSRNQLGAAHYIDALRFVVLLLLDNQSNCVCVLCVTHRFVCRLATLAGHAACWNLGIKDSLYHTHTSTYVVYVVVDMCMCIHTCVRGFVLQQGLLRLPDDLLHLRAGASQAAHPRRLALRPRHLPHLPGP